MKLAKHYWVTSQSPSQKRVFHEICNALLICCNELEDSMPKATEMKKVTADKVMQMVERSVNQKPHEESDNRMIGMMEMDDLDDLYDEKDFQSDEDADLGLLSFKVDETEVEVKK